jgi:hypothetical protein
MIPILLMTHIILRQMGEETDGDDPRNLILSAPTLSMDLTD